MSLARATLRHDLRRYGAAISAVAFSGLLMIVQSALLLGMFGTVSVLIDRSSADLWAVDPGTVAFDVATDMPRQNEMLLRRDPDIASVQAMSFKWSRWRKPQGGGVSVMVAGLDPAPGGLSFPSDFDPGLRIALTEPGAVVIDETDLSKLGVKPGDHIEVNGQRARLVGVVRGYRAASGTPFVFASQATALSFYRNWSSPDEYDFFLVKLTEPARLDAVRARIAANDAAPMKLITSAEFSLMTHRYWLTETGTGFAFGFSTLIALVVGLVVTGQTLRGAVLAQAREFAALRAIGAPFRALAAIVMEQAFWVGVAGLLLAALLTLPIALGAQAFGVLLVFQPWAIGVAGGVTLLTAVISGVFALGPLYRSDPVMLLR